MNASRRLRICFVAPAIYPVLSGDTSLKLVGGAEVQQNFLARELAKRGHQISVVCMDHGQPDGQLIDGIKVFHTHKPMSGLPVVRFFHPRFTSVWQAMARADADVYYQRSGAVLTGFVSAFARRNKRACVFSSASDLDFDVNLPLLRYWRDKQIYCWGVRNVSSVVVQTERQATECRAMFGIESESIGSCYNTRANTASQSGPIVWVASVKPIKRPELFVALARACPEYQFKMIGGGSDVAMEKLRHDAKGVANLTVVGFVPFAQVDQHFDGAAVHVNTSVNEGFPNTFMQAWAGGTPTLSFFDPGAALQGQVVGFVVDSFDEMVQKIKMLKTDASLWALQSLVCRNYLAEHHSVERAGNAYEALFTRLVAEAGMTTPL